MYNIILIPYRKREEHLKYFIENTYPLLKKHLTNLKIVIIEQFNDKLFNRGILLNIGFTENLNDEDTIYFTHDIDVNPYEETIIKYYKTNDIDNNSIKGIYTSVCNTLGGVICFKKEIFKKINGFPNFMWGWGVEDKVLQNRAEFYKVKIYKNILSNSKDSIESFKIFYNNHEKKTENLDEKTRFEYYIYRNLSDLEKEQHNKLLGGIDNLNYHIINTENINDDIKIIKVNF
jgi:hypothetical protein